MTGLEPATSGVTGRRSNQLSYIRNTVTAGQITGLREGRDIGSPPITCQAEPGGLSFRPAGLSSLPRHALEPARESPAEAS